MDKERLVQIGKFLNARLIIHRNVENNTPWTTEEKMIQELYDNYLDLLIKYKNQKEVINRAIDYINSNPNVFYDEHLIDVETLKNNEMTDEYVGEIRFISNLLSILEGSDNE